MLSNVYSNSEINSLNRNYEDLDYKSPGYLKVKNSQSQLHEGNQYNNKESYASPFKMMANSNILLSQSQSFKDIRQPQTRNNENIFQFPANGYQKDFRSGMPDVKELRDFQSQQSLPKSINMMNEIPNQLQNNNFEQPQKKQYSGRLSTLDQSIQEYQKFFPHLNYSHDQKDHNTSLLNYLTNQESELLQTLSRLQNNSQQKQLKLKHLQIVSQLIQNLKEKQVIFICQKNYFNIKMQFIVELLNKMKEQTIQTKIQLTEEGHVESVSYNKSDGFYVKLHQLEKIPNDVDSIQIDYGIFRKGDLLKTYRQTDKLASVSFNWKYNKCIINHEEMFSNVYPTVYTFIYFDVKVFSKNIKEPKAWSWTLHTLFTEDKKLLQGCFKLPLYSKNHIPHAIFQTGFPFLSESFLYIEVFLKHDYQLGIIRFSFIKIQAKLIQIGTQMEFSKYVIPKLHLKERQLDNIEEDVVVNQFVEEHIRQKGMIKSTFRDDELQMREYNARQKLKIIKKEEPLYVPWAQQETLNNIVDNLNQKSYIKQKDQSSLDSGDIFDQISQVKEKKKITQPKLKFPTSIQEIPELPEQDIQQPYTSRRIGKQYQKEEEDNYFYVNKSQTRKDSNQLSETSQKLVKKREERSKDRLDTSTSKPSRGSISVTMQKILEKRNQQKQELSQSYITNNNIIKQNEI